MIDKDVREFQIHKFRALRDELEASINQLGLVTIGEAAEIRQTSRSAILQLMQRGRLTIENVLGKQLVYRDEIENFTAKKPGPQLDTVFKARKPKD